MCLKIRNAFLKNKKLVIKSDLIIFDNNGIGEIKNKDIYNQLLTLNGYLPYGEEIDNQSSNTSKDEKQALKTENKASKNLEIDKNSVESAENEYNLKDSGMEVGIDYNLESMTVKELEKYAKENNIALEGATKKADIIKKILVSK